MNKGIWTIAGGTAALCAALIATPGYTVAQRAHVPGTQEMPEPEVRDFNVMFGEEGGSWLGVETREVTSDNAKELKLPGERGVVLGRIATDSPASKSGLRENDVVTEINGQQVEGAMQFRRMIREIPAGRSVQLTVWRDGRTQKINVTLGKAEELRRNMTRVAPGMPGTFAFHVPDFPDLPEVAEIPEMPSMEFDGNMLYAGHPRLGIDAEDLAGQLGSFFGAPDGEGILVRSVNSGSPAEKAGVKAGDVITSLNGERIRSVGDLRQKLAAQHGEKDKDAESKDKESKDRTRTVKLGVLRNKSEISLNVELPAPATTTRHVIARRTNI
ncbi:MAG TPA: PDZ domain-containing protein [Methylomirabilota bacterium]|nr:PDZ domain-containing protein [Methylomirabilota bacterium]